MSRKFSVGGVLIILIMEWKNTFQDLNVYLENYASLTILRNGKIVTPLKIHWDLFCLIYNFSGYYH